MSFFVRRAMRLPQIQSQAASFTQRRGLADAAGKDGAAKVNKNGGIGLLVSLLGTFLYFNYRQYRREKEALHNENKEDLSEEGSSVFGANQGSYHIRASRRA